MNIYITVFKKKTPKTQFNISFIFKDIIYSDLRNTRSKYLLISNTEEVATAQYSTVELTRKCTASVDEQWSQATDADVKVQTRYVSKR